MKPKTWRILGFAAFISMTTCPLSSCELPLTNRDPNDLTEASSLPKKLYLTGIEMIELLLYFGMFFKQIWSSTNQQIPQFS